MTTPRAIREPEGDQKCSVCTHTDRLEIDRAILAGVSSRAIEARWHAGRSAVNRHKAREHVARELGKAREVSQIADAGELLGEVNGLRQRALDILESAERAGKHTAALAAIREARECLILIGKVVGIIEGKGATVNIDQRMQILHTGLSNLSEDDLRSLAASGRRDVPAA